MDFDSLLTTDAHDEGAEVNILNPITGEETDVFIKVLGIDSIEFQRASRRQRNKMYSRLSSKKALDEADDIAEEIEQLAAITVGWRGITKAGKPVKFSAGKCVELYTKSPGLRQQVDRFVGDRRNFTKG